MSGSFFSMLYLWLLFVLFKVGFLRLLFWSFNGFVLFTGHGRRWNILWSERYHHQHWNGKTFRSCPGSYFVKTFVLSPVSVFLIGDLSLCLFSVTGHFLPPRGVCGNFFLFFTDSEGKGMWIEKLYIGFDKKKFILDLLKGLCYEMDICLWTMKLNQYLPTATGTFCMCAVSFQILD